MQSLWGRPQSDSVCNALPPPHPVPRPPSDTGHTKPPYPPPPLPQPRKDAWGTAGPG